MKRLAQTLSALALVLFTFSSAQVYGKSGSAVQVRTVDKKKLKKYEEYVKKNVSKVILGLAWAGLNVTKLKVHQLYVAYVLFKEFPKCFKTVDFKDALKRVSSPHLLPNFLKAVAKRAKEDSNTACLQQILKKSKAKSKEKKKVQKKADDSKKKKSDSSTVPNTQQTRSQGSSGTSAQGPRSNESGGSISSPASRPACRVSCKIQRLCKLMPRYCQQVKIKKQLKKAERSVPKLQRIYQKLREHWVKMTRQRDKIKKVVDKSNQGICILKYYGVGQASIWKFLKPNQKKKFKDCLFAAAQAKRDELMAKLAKLGYRNYKKNNLFPYIKFLVKVTEDEIPTNHIALAAARRREIVGVVSTHVVPVIQSSNFWRVVEVRGVQSVEQPVGERIAVVQVVAGVEGLTLRNARQLQQNTQKIKQLNKRVGRVEKNIRNLYNRVFENARDLAGIYKRHGKLIKRVSKVENNRIFDRLAVKITTEAVILAPFANPLEKVGGGYSQDIKLNLDVRAVGNLWLTAGLMVAVPKVQFRRLGVGVGFEIGALYKLSDKFTFEGDFVYRADHLVPEFSFRSLGLRFLGGRLGVELTPWKGLIIGANIFIGSGMKGFSQYLTLGLGLKIGWKFE